MVLLRLEVRVFPKEPAPTLSSERGGPNTSVFSRLIGNGVGNRNKEAEQNGDRADSYDLGEANPAKQYASFLLLLRNSDDITLADLARRICDEWATFRSDQEPLEIKKLLDDANPTVDLSLSMTVADVFLDVGKAFSDGHDQRAIVRVIQKPARHAPQRFSSVVQDWDGAVNKGYQHNSRVGNQFSPIAEEGYAPASAQKSPAGQRPHDAPLPSVEIQSKYHRNEAIPGTPPMRSSGSEELGDSPSPEQGRRSKKRKPSPGENGPVKQRRVDEEQLEATEASLTNPQRKRVNVPTFASPHRRASLSERPAANNSIGLGVTKSPLFKKPAKRDTPSSQNPGPMSTPTNAPTPSGSMLPPSAIRKSSPASINSEKRRSVSFNEQQNLNSQPNPQVSSSKAKTPRTKGSKPAVKNPASCSRGSSNIPPSSNTSTPMTQEEREQEERDKQFARVKKEVMEKISLKNKLKDPTTKPKVISIVKEMLDIFAQVDDRKSSGEDQSTRPINRLKRKLSPLRKRLIAAEAEPTGDAQETETSESQEEEPEPEAEPEPEPEPEPETSLPAADARVTRSVNFTPTAPTNPNQAPTWSFDKVPSSTQKPVTRRESQSPRRRRSRSSATGSQTSPPRQSPITRPSRSPSVVVYKSPRRGSQSGSVNNKAPIKPHHSVQNADTDMEMKDTDENDEVATEVATQETAQEATMDATPEQTEEVTENVNEEATEEASEESNNEAEHPAIDDANQVEEQGDESDSDEVAETDPTGDAEMTDDREESPEFATNGLIDDVAMEDEEEEEDEQDEEEEEDEDRDGFIDDEPEESEDEEVYEDAKDHEGSGEDVANGTVDAQPEESDKSNDQLPAQLNENKESGAESTEVPKGNLEVTSKGNADSEDESSKSDESESESESELELPSLRRSNRKQPNTPKPAAPGFQSTQQLASSQPKSAPKTTLKSLLQAAKQESTRQQKPAPAPAIAAKPRNSSASKPKSNVWEVPSSDDESNDSDDSEQGDILPNGDSRKPRKPYSLRG